MKTISQHLTAGALAVAGTVATFGLGSVAQAAQLSNATLGFIPIGNVGFSGGTGLGSATTIDFPGINSVNQTGGDFTTGTTVINPGAPITLTDPFTVGSLISFSVGLANGSTGTFTATATTITAQTADSLAILFNGDFVSSNGTFDDTFSSLSISFTTVGAGIANYSATFASPANQIIDVPEPGTLLGILAVAGAGALARRKR